MEPLLLIPFGISFLISLLMLPVWIKKAKECGISGKDVHKISEKKVAEAGGIIVLLGFILGTLSYVALITFVFESSLNLLNIFVVLSSVLLAAMIGFSDDILGWKIGLNKRTKILLLFLASIPLVVINAGESTMMGVNFGLIYPLFFIPLGLVGATASFNMIAGYNGLEASQGILLLSALSIVCWLTGNSWISVLLLLMVFPLLAFYLFNSCPARVFPGDVLTYIVGIMIAITAIMGNLEKIAIFFFLPYVLEIVLKLRGGLEKQSYGKLGERGIENRYSKIYGIEHLAINILKKIKYRVQEKDIVYLINLFQIIIILLGFLVFREYLF
jgi:UDP-N-acetylglucosamine--dolichyl-phosphate N-acetylglucosaminephosphotransferase